MRAAQSAEFQVDKDKPYAELWIGTHPNGMSQILNEEDGNPCGSLLEYVQSNPEMHLGKTGQKDLTFLFKVLSIEKVLSIQAHPDKKLAEQLHASRPHIYKDPNHKPEMAVALTDDFEAMCGFRPVKAIAENLRKFPEFRAVIGEEAAERVCALEHATHSTAIRSVLRNMFWKFNTADDDLVQDIEHVIYSLGDNPDKGILDITIDSISIDEGLAAPYGLAEVELTVVYRLEN